MNRNDRITAGDLCKRIAAVHAPPEWACFFEVANSTGSNVRRYADAVAMSLWPSRGLTLRGFEVKVSRQDLKKEAADPMKAETVAKYCDEWWVVAPPDLVRDVDLELPPAWGLMVAKEKGGLRVARAATMTEAAPISRGFLASILRRAQGMVAKENEGWVRRENIQDEINKAIEHGKTLAPIEAGIVKRDFGHLQKRVEDFKIGTGIDLTDPFNWRVDVARISHCYRLGSALDGEYHGGSIRNMVDSLRCVEKGAKDMLKSLADIESKDEQSRVVPTVVEEEVAR